MVFSGDTTSPTGISFLPPYLAVRHRIMPVSSQNCCMRYLPRTQFSPLLLPFYSTSLCSPFHNSPVFLPRTQFSPLLPTFFPTSLCFPFHSKHIFPSITQFSPLLCVILSTHFFELPSNYIIGIPACYQISS